MTDSFEYEELPKIDLLEFLTRHGITMMLESGMSFQTVVTYVNRIPYSNPLRNHFVSIIVSFVIDEEKDTLRKMLLGNAFSNTTTHTVHAEKSTFRVVVNAYQDEKTLNKLFLTLSKHERDSDIGTYKVN